MIWPFPETASEFIPHRFYLGRWGNMHFFPHVRSIQVQRGALYSDILLVEKPSDPCPCWNEWCFFCIIGHLRKKKPNTKERGWLRMANWELHRCAILLSFMSDTPVSLNKLLCPWKLICNNDLIIRLAELQGRHSTSLSLQHRQTLRGRQ